MAGLVGKTARAIQESKIAREGAPKGISMLERLSKKAEKKRYVGGAAVAGGLYGVFSSNVIEGDEETYGLQQALFEGALNDPYADVAVVGKKVNMLNAGIVNNGLGPISFPDTFKNASNAQYLNSVSFDNYEQSQNTADWQWNRGSSIHDAGSQISAIAQGNVDRGYAEKRWAGSNYPYKNTQASPRVTQNDPNMGSMVIGAYNLRHGG